MTRFGARSNGRIRRIFLLSGLGCLLGTVLAAFTSTAYAQQLTGTLSGTAYDQSGAVVPKAQVVLKNQTSGDVRTATTENDGHFVITAVQPATYSIVVSATGFSSWQENDIVMNQGDHRDVPNIKLNVGGNSTQVNVIAGGDAVVPTDTAEISTSLNEQMINDFPLQGRDAGELLKIMPGMALNVGTSQGTNFDQKVGSNNGPVGDYSSNGTQPNGTMAYMLDGANLVDPGNFGTQIANINQDMVANVKVLTSDYGAEYAKGPVIFQAFSKSGGSQFHGEAYLYTHNATLNSVDAYTKSQGGTNAAQSYYYIGGNVGGPIILPHFMHYNQNHNKLFFWAGYEYMKQQPAGSIVNYNVPNTAQLSGDFSNAGVPAAAIAQWPKFYGQLSQNLPTGGTATSFPVTDIDPNAPGLLNLYPKPNQTPSSGNGYNNYQYVNTSPQNRWEATGKVDYALSDNDKITGSYAYQKEADLAPISIWWALPSTLPYPSPGASQTVTYIILTNYTHVFSPTTTNEFVFTWSHFVNPYALSDPAKASRAANNFNVPGLFGHTTSQIPNIEPDYCCSEQMASINYYPIDGGFGGVKQVPAFYDNFTKVVGDHTLKAGFYWDSSQNNQNANSPSNGTYEIATGNSNSTNNLVADTMLGRITNYTQQNVNVPQDTKYHQWSIWAQDSWKAAKTLTINYGMRFDHVGQWYGYPNGMQVWDPGSYVNGANAPANTGLLWHAKASQIPLSGFKSPLFYLAPRLGFAYDIFGTGRTVFRGGYAVYRYQATSETASAGGGPAGSFGYTTPTVFDGYANIATFTPPSSVNQNGTGSYNTVDAMQEGDDRAPFTNNWNATISQSLPKRSVLEVSYIGNRSGNEYQDGSNSNIYNINNVAPGGFFQPDPLTGSYVSPSAPGCTGDESLYCKNNPGAYTPSFNANHYRPLQQYGNFILLTHSSWQNYNALQVSYQKQSGPITFVTNYSFSKVLGVRDGASNNGPGNGIAVDPFNIRNNYGPLGYDHTHILNFVYNWQLPNFIHSEVNPGMKVLGGAINGWKVSGYTAFQSGAPIQPTLSANLNANFASGLTVPTNMHPNLPDNSIKLPNGLVSTSVNTSTYFGSNAYNVLLPTLVCNPLKGLHKVSSGDGMQGMRFNPACFANPAPPTATSFGQQGPNVYPYMRLPNYWDSDLGIYKSFHVTESQSLQIRASATNFLNHPLGQFGLANNSDTALNFQQTTPATCTGCVTSNGTPISIISIAPTNVSPTVTGAPAFKTGARFVTLAVKYYF